jgi:preprotein translocase subunit SecG
MNDVTSFLAVTAIVFTAVTVLLVLMSHLELRGVGSRHGEGSSNASRSETDPDDGV